MVTEHVAWLSAFGVTDVQRVSRTPSLTPASRWRRRGLVAQLGQQNAFEHALHVVTAGLRVHRATNELGQRDLAVAEFPNELADRGKLVELLSGLLHHLVERAEGSFPRLALHVAQLARELPHLVQELAIAPLELAAPKLRIAVARQRALALPSALELDQTRQIALLVGASDLLHHFGAALSVRLLARSIRVHRAGQASKNVAQRAAFLTWLASACHFAH